MTVNLAEDWKRRFGAIHPEAEPEPVERKALRPPLSKKIPIPSQKSREVIIEDVDVNEEEEELDLVVDRRPRKAKPDADTWARNVDTRTKVEPRPKVLHRAEPVVAGRKVYVSGGTANWGMVRAGTYPLYKEWCELNNMRPSLLDFNSILAPQWKALSPEDKVKAAQHPELYFTFE